MSHYLLSVNGPTQRTEPGSHESEQEHLAEMEETDRFNERLRARGVLVFVDALAPVGTATVVDGLGSAPILTDGPYLESKEGLNGLWIIDVPDLDAALKIAAEASHVCREVIEVRPFAGS